MALPKQARHPEPDLPAVDVTFVTYRRGDRPDWAGGGGAGGRDSSDRDSGARALGPEACCGIVRRIVREFKPDILETHNIKSHFLVRANGLHRQFPWVAWNHGYTSKDRLDRAYKQFDRYIFSKEIIDSKTEEVKKQIELQVINTMNELLTAEKGIMAAEARLKNAREGFRLVKRKYEEGESSLIEFIDARTTLTQAEENLIISKFSYLSCFAEFEKVTAITKTE